MAATLEAPIWAILPNEGSYAIPEILRPSWMLNSTINFKT